MNGSRTNEMEASQHIIRLNQIIKALTDELHIIDNEGHISTYNESWELLNDIELDIDMLRKFILKEVT